MRANAPVRKNGGRVAYAQNRPNLNMANAGALRIPGRTRDAGRYGERLREDRKYPNRRKRIITGKELTTPLARKKKIEKVRLQKAKKAKIKVETIPVEKNRFPLNVIFGLVIASAFLFASVMTQNALNEQNDKINKWGEKINAEDKKEKNLKNELETKNDFSFFIEYAVNELEMVKEESNSIKKTYIYGKSSDKAEVLAEKRGSFIEFPEIMSTIFKKK